MRTVLYGLSGGVLPVTKVCQRALLRRGPTQNYDQQAPRYRLRSRDDLVMLSWRNCWNVRCSWVSGD